MKANYRIYPHCRLCLKVDFSVCNDLLTSGRDPDFTALRRLVRDERRRRLLGGPNIWLFETCFAYTRNLNCRRHRLTIQTRRVNSARRSMQMGNHTQQDNLAVLQTSNTANPSPWYRHGHRPAKHIVTVANTMHDNPTMHHTAPITTLPRPDSMVFPIVTRSGLCKLFTPQRSTEARVSACVALLLHCARSAVSQWRRASRFNSSQNFHLSNCQQNVSAIHSHAPVPTWSWICRRVTHVRVIIRR